MRSPSRRRVLGTLTTTAAVLHSGCAFDRGPSSGHLFVENTTGARQRVALGVARTGDGEQRIVHGVYRIPASRALQFEGVLEGGHEYEIRAFQESASERERLSATLDTCQEGDPADRTDVSVLVSPNGPDIRVWNCDGTYSYEDELTYVDPSEFRVGTPRGTVATDTPS